MKTFRVSKCKTSRADCCFEFTDNKKQVFFEVSLHGAIELHEHFIELGYTELAPKLEFPSWHPNHEEVDKTTHQIDCHKSLSNRDKEYIFEVVREALAEQGFPNPETIEFNLTALCTTSAELSVL